MDCKEGPLNQVKVNIEGKTWDVDMCNFKNNVTEELQNSTAYMFLDTIRQECFSENSTYTPQVGEDLGPRPYCPRTFDGFSCWVETAASTIAMNPCPDFIVGFDAKQTALKSCTKNGTWDLDPQILPGWTNYKNCINVKNGYTHGTAVNYFVAGHIMSFLWLVFGFMLIKYLKNIHCTRTSILMHLYASFAVHNLLWIIWYTCVLGRVEILEIMWCIIFHVLWNYFMLSSYGWLFCFGLHLHLSVKVVFVKEYVVMHRYKFLSWMMPMVISLLYYVVRILYVESPICSVVPVIADWILAVPLIICLVLSICFFAKVVLVLIEKLHTTLRRSRAATARKIFRAAGILIIPWIVPFFGLHMILQPLRPILDSPNTEFYQRFAAGASCLQGLYIATLFCLSNKEVMDELKKRVIKRWRKRAANALIARRNTARRNMIQAIREEVV